MSNQQRIGELLTEAAETHHRVYRLTDGADPDWASWYASWLIGLSPLPELLGRKPINSELVWLLVSLDRQYTTDQPEVSWEAFYANGIASHLARNDQEIRITEYDGSRDELRNLFALAEGSAAELESYLRDGRVLVARRSDRIIAHLQLVDTDRPDAVEIKNMAVMAEEQGRGIGARLVGAAVELAVTENRAAIVVATATADIGNLRFYQRQGFRFRSVERDAFTAATGYPPGTSVDGVPLRDRIWLDRPIGPTGQPR
jgi:predicted N-acetyltransferase YhbS